MIFVPDKKILREYERERTQGLRRVKKLLRELYEGRAYEKKTIAKIKELRAEWEREDASLKELWKKKRQTPQSFLDYNRASIELMYMYMQKEVDLLQTEINGDNVIEEANETRNAQNKSAD